MLVVLSMPSLASAQVSPQDVWDNLAAYSGTFGSELSATLSQSGDTLTATDVTVTFLPNGDHPLQISLGEMSLTGQPDGTVTVIYPEDQLVKMAEIGPEANESGTLRITRTDLNLIASGTPGDITYTATASAFGIELVEVQDNNPDALNRDIAFNFQGTGMVASTRINTLADLASTTNSTAYDTLLVDITAQPSLDESQKIKFFLTDAKIGYSVTRESTRDGWTSFTDALRNGLAMGITATAKEMALDGTIVEPGDPPFDMRGTAKNADVVYGLSSKGLDYLAGSQGIELMLAEQSDLPFQINAAIDSIRTKFLLPILPSEDVQYLTVDLDYKGLTIGDDLWDMADPGAILSRDPAALRLSTKIGLLLRAGFFDGLEEGAAAPGPGMDVTDVEIYELHLAALGASFDGTADVTIDMDGTEHFFGLPSPTGVSNFTLTGAHGLLDNLVALGLIGNADTFPARSFIGLLTTATDTPDVLTSTIEVDGDSGAVTANGIKVR